MLSPISGKTTLLHGPTPEEWSPRTIFWPLWKVGILVNCYLFCESSLGNQNFGKLHTHDNSSLVFLF